MGGVWRSAAAEEPHLRAIGTSRTGEYMDRPQTFRREQLRAPFFSRAFSLGQ
jgi:hypothetical protein